MSKAEQEAHAENAALHLRALREHAAANPGTCTCKSAVMSAAGIKCPVHA